MNAPSRESLYPNPCHGLFRLFQGILLFLASLSAIIVGGVLCTDRLAIVGAPLIVLGLLGIPGTILVFRGLVLVNPNQSKVVVLFGKYTGTLRQDGFYWVNPFASRRKVSLRAHNFNSDKLKVNDQRGNPIEI